MSLQTKFKFSDSLYVFWLIEWFDKTKGQTLIRCEELQTPQVRILQIQAERDIRYRAGDEVNRFFAPWKVLIPCAIENEDHLERVRGWLAKFGEKNGFENLAITSRGEIAFSHLAENEQLDLFEEKVEKEVDKKIESE